MSAELPSDPGMQSETVIRAFPQEAMIALAPLNHHAKT